MGTTFHVYNVSDDALHPTVRRSASKVLTRAITSKIDITVPSFKLPRSEEYDPHKHRNVAKPTTYGDTMMHLLKACFGAGLLALPNAMYRLGIVFGSLGVALLGFFACYCIQLLILAQYTLCKRKKVGYLSFPATMRVAVAEGPPFMRRSAGFFGAAVETLLIIWQFGVCAIFLVFISENLKQIITSFGGSELNIRILICCLYPPLVAICMIKDLKMLVPLSTFSNVCNLFGIILIFYYLSYEDIEFTDRHYQLKSVMDIPVFIGLVLFAIEAVAVVLALEYNMENPKEFTGWLGLFSIATIIIVVIYTGFGFFGYLKYGDECKASITLNLPQDEKKAQVAKGAFALTIFTSYPLQNFVAWQLVWALLEKRFNSSRKADLALRVVCSSGPFVMALAAPALGPFIGLLGSFCLSTAAIIFPAIVDICVYYPNQYGPGSYKLLTDVAVILVGIVCCVSGVYTSVLEMNDELS